MSAVGAPHSRRNGRPGPSPAGFWKRLTSWLTWPVVDRWRRGYAWWLLARGKRTPRRWWRLRTCLIIAVFSLIVLAYIVGLAYAVELPGFRGEDWPAQGAQHSAAWEAMWLVALAFIPVVATATYFSVWRYWWRARSRYLHKAKTRPEDLVKPGSIFGSVVGRDQLCDALINDLRDAKRRRPQVIVGAIGVGKTALLVRLTARLARKGIVPVVLQLGDVRDENLDFSDLAKKQFLEEVREWGSAPAEAEAIWQRLRYTDHVVVLADGLEELPDDFVGRDNKIRTAIADAHAQKLPLVMTSRPQGPLRGIDVFQTVLEPLSEEAALEYVAQGGGSYANKRRMDWVVEAAGVAESPLYLNIARDLEERDLLEQAAGGAEDALGDPRDQDVWALRYDLLDTWVEALKQGRLHPEQPLSHYGRSMTIEYLSALACAALRTNSTEVRYDALAQGETADGPAPGGNGDEEAVVKAAILRRLMEQRASEMSGKGRETGTSLIDARLAGSWGGRLGLVEESGTGVRFQHSVLQAFLASRYVGALLEPHADLRGPASRTTDRTTDSAGSAGGGSAVAADGFARSASTLDTYFNKAARGCTGRELGMALIFFSRSNDALAACHGSHGQQCAPDVACSCPVDIVRGRLWRLAAQAMKSFLTMTAEQDGAVEANRSQSAYEEQDPRLRALELYGATLDVDSFHHSPQHRAIVREICGHWERRDLQEYYDDKLDAGKKALIKRIGADGRLLSGRQAMPLSRADAVRGETAYDLLFRIARVEPSHRVRFTVAQQIGEGRDAAFHDISTRPLQPGRRERRGETTRHRPGERRRVARSAALHETRPSEFGPEFGAELAGGSSGPGSGSRSGSGSDAAAGIPAADAPGRYAVSGTTVTERLLRRHRSQVLAERQKREEEDERRDRETLDEDQRARIMHAWIAPMLVNSCDSSRHSGTPYEKLTELISRVRGHQAALAEQAALAQGFRQAANRHTTSATPTARDFLSEQAQEMLKHTRYWFARLALLHALTLWELPDNPDQGQPRYGHGANPRRQVKQWLEPPDCPTGRSAQRPEHPLVRAAARMAHRTLQTRRPDRFLWIDEEAMVTRIGCDTGSPREPRRHRLWIPPSRGWSTLDPVAQQLLADVLVLLTLTDERGDPPQESELRLERVSRIDPPRLPACIARDRNPLDSKHALVGGSQYSLPGRSLPGSTCADNCPYLLCPYPPKGPECRSELSELFCAQQYAMLNRLQLQAWLGLRFRRRAQWQRGVPVANLRRFWDDMGSRSRDRSLTGPRPN